MQPLEAVCRWRDTQLQVGANYDPTTPMCYNVCSALSFLLAFMHHILQGSLSHPGKPGKWVFPVREKSGNLRKVLQVREKSGNFIMFNCPKKKVLVTSVCCFFLNQMKYQHNNNDWLWCFFVCGNPSFSVSCLVAAVNLTWTIYAKESKGKKGEKSGKIQGILFHEILGTLI